MPDSSMPRKWDATGTSIQGASHIRAQKPNQDAIDWQQHEAGLPLVIAIADGHGSSKSFRSHLGSEIAVKIANNAILTFLLDEVKGILDLQIIEQLTRERLTETIVSCWREKVLENLEHDPFTQTELDELSQKENRSSLDLINTNPLLAYGATLLCAAVTSDFILYLQIGDGDILCVDSYGETRRLFPEDQRLIAEETTSLCMENAVQEFRIKVESCSIELPSMILISTDGYSKSFRTDEDFLKIGMDYLQMVRQSGLDIVAKHLPAYLRDASQQGSGDDITLGIIKRLEPLETDAVLNLFTAVETFQEGLKEKAELTEVQDMLATERRANQEMHEHLRIHFVERHNKLEGDLQLIKQTNEEQVISVNDRVSDTGLKLSSHDNELKRIADLLIEDNNRITKVEALVRAHESEISNLNEDQGEKADRLHRAWLAIILAIVIALLGLIFSIIILIR